MSNFKVGDPKVIYLSAPYRGKTVNDIRINIRKAEAVAAELWKQGYYVICPHLNSAFFDGLVDDSVFLAADIEILKRCDAMVLAGCWKDSKGCQVELEVARQHKIPVYVYTFISNNVVLLPIDTKEVTYYSNGEKLLLNTE